MYQKLSRPYNRNCIKEQTYSYNSIQIQNQMFQNVPTMKSFKDYTQADAKAYRRKLALKIKEVLESEP